MAKRSRHRRPKRTSRGQATQLDHKLSKRARQLYLPGEGWSEEVEDALADEVAGLAPEPPPARGRPEGTPRPERAAAADAGPTRPARVVALWSGGARVETPDGEELDCVLASRLARDQQSTVAVGDRVEVAAAGEGAACRVALVQPRATWLSRPDPTNPRLERVIAANVDVVVVVASLVRPPLRPALVDRYLIAVERGGAAAVLALNKVDLAGDDDRAAAEAVLAPYRELGVPVVPVSAKTGEGLDELRRRLEGIGEGNGEGDGEGDRTAVFVGHSGVGKSSLLNALEPAIAAATAAVDARAGKGRHTTTGSRLHRLAGGVRVIDTPGIRELGLWRITLPELRAAFPDLHAPATGCRFADCTHTHEPGCAVRAAVAAGDLDRRRYDTYRRILESVDGAVD